ncbi:MAG: thioredoxin [Melioribacteraceae bacterium]
MQPFVFTDANFETEAIKSDLPVLVDFWAVWCGPCKMIGPIIEELAGEFDGKVKIGKLDVDNNQQTAVKFGVRSIPTVLLLKDGEIKDTIIGAVPKSVFISKIEAVL